MSAKPPVFVVSTGRCGSTLLSDMIRRHPQAVSLSEFFTVMLPAFPPGLVDGPRFWELLSRPKKRWTLMLRLDIGIDEILYRPGPPARFTLETGVPPLLLVPLPHLTENAEALFDELADWVPGLDAGPVHEQYRRLFDWLCDRFGGQVWVERSGSSLSWLDELIRGYPAARFIHMYRDGRDCALSMAKHNAYRLTTVSRQLFKRLGVDPFSSDDPPLAPVPPALRPFMPETFDRARYLDLRIPADELGRAWSQTTLMGCEALARLEPGRVTHLRYETLCANPASEMRRLARFIGIDEDERWIAEISTMARSQKSRWTELSGLERRRLVEACAPGMELLYGTATGAVGPEPPGEEATIGGLRSRAPSERLVPVPRSEAG